MLKYIKLFYNFLMKLKQYHATHALVIPFFAAFVHTYYIIWLIILNDKYGMNITINVEFSNNLLIILLLIFGVSIYITIFIAIFTFILQFIIKRKIYIKSNFLLNNKYYNFLYLFSFLNFLIIIVCRVFPFLHIQDCYTFILLVLPEKILSLLLK